LLLFFNFQLESTTTDKVITQNGQLIEDRFSRPPRQAAAGTRGFHTSTQPPNKV
jgi:hypothetical protein